MHYLLDTNICIYLMKVHPPTVVERFKRTPIGHVGVSVVTYSELRHGIERCPPEDRALEKSDPGSFFCLPTMKKIPFALSLATNVLVEARFPWPVIATSFCIDLSLGQPHRCLA